MPSLGSVNNGIGAKFLAIGQVNGVLTVSVAGVTATISLNVPTDGFYWYRIWLSDSATDPTVSLHAPSGGGATSWEGFTDSSGDATVAFAMTGASRTWYVWGRMEVLNVSAALTVGV